MSRFMWKDKTTHVEFFNWVAKKLNITKNEDWYKIQTQDVKKLGGDTLLNHYYGNSLSRALIEVYPQNNWQVWRFQAIPKGTWQDITVQRQFFDHIGKELHISQP